MTDRIMQAYLDVERAMQHYNIVLDEYVTSLQTKEASDTIKLERIKAGSKAMLNSRGICVSYAKFVAYGMPKSEEPVEEDLQT